MKANRKIKLLSLAIIGLMIASANVSFSQDEYDDMYFNPKDRKEVKFKEDAAKSSVTTESFENKAIAKNTTQSDVINPTYSPSEYGNLEENYSTKTVNPEYIARYKNNPKESTVTEEVTEGDSYYDDYYERTVMPGETEQSTDKKKYAYPSSYYGGSNAAMRSRMYANSYYDPFMGGGFGPSMSFGLGYSFGYMPGFSMNIGYGTGMGYGGYNPYGFYDPFSPFGNPYYMSRYYDPFYSPWAYDPYYSSMRYGYGRPGYYCPSPYYGGYGGGLSTGYVVVQTTGVKVSNTNANPESNRLESPSYRNRIARGSDQYSGDRKDVPNTRTAASRNNTVNESQSVANARTASDRDFSRSQNEYYNRSGSRNATSTVSSNRSTNRSTVTSTRSASRSSVGSTNTARVRSSRANSDYSRPTYRSSREQRAVSSGSSGRSSWSSGNSRSSGSYSTPTRSSGSSYSGSSGSRSISSGTSSGSYSSGGSRSSGSSGGSSRSSRGN